MWIISYIFSTILTAIPLWVWIILAIIAVLVAYRLLGVRGSLAALGAVAIAIAVIFGEKRGRDFQIRKDSSDADKLIKRANDARARADKLAGNSGVRPDARPEFPPREYRD